MRILVDTNILLRCVQRKHSSQQLAFSALKALHRQQNVLHVLPQNLIEFWNVCTRRADANGLGYSIALTDRLLKRFERMLFVLPGSIQIFQVWRTLVMQYGVTGSSVHDAKLVAGMRVHGIIGILTFDSADFARYAGLQLLHPRAVSAQEV